MSNQNDDSELSTSEEVAHDNNLQGTDHERIPTQPNHPSDAEHGESEPEKTLSDCDQQKVDISEVITVIHPFSDEHKGALSENQRKAIKKGDFVRVVGGWRNSNVLVCPEVLWLEVVDVQQYHFKVEINKPARFFIPDFERRFWLPKTTVTDVRNGKYFGSRAVQKGECPLCGRKGRKSQRQPK